MPHSLQVRMFGYTEYFPCCEHCSPHHAPPRIMGHVIRCWDCIADLARRDGAEPGVTERYVAAHHGRSEF